MDDYEDFFADDQRDNYQAEAKAFERVGGGGKLAELLDSPDTLEKMEGKEGRVILSPKDRFLISTDALCRRLHSEHVATLTEQDITKILTSATLLRDLQYKNYVGFVLGYLASKGGEELNPITVKNVIDNVLPVIGSEGGITPPDIIRYGRYWKIYL